MTGKAENTKQWELLLNEQIVRAELLCTGVRDRR